MAWFRRPKPPKADDDLKAVGWVPQADNPWRVPVIDVRPVTQHRLSFATDRKPAETWGSVAGADGREFIGKPPVHARAVDVQVRYRVGDLLADGVLFKPETMEDKWAIFHFGGQITFVRSWTGEVAAVVNVRREGTELAATHLRGAFVGENEDQRFSARTLQYLLHSHALGLVVPAPLPPEVGKPADAALWCMGMFGRRALFATPHDIDLGVPEVVLRTHSLLHIAVARGETGEVERQIEAGVPPDLLAADGLAPLHWAVPGNHISVMELLLDRGASVDVRAAEGTTPLMVAAQSGCTDAAAYLLQRGAVANARDNRGFTALHRAAEVGFEEIVRLLVDHGADSSVDAQGHTPLSLARSQKRTAIIRLLEAPAKQDGP